jgi:alpha-tubulin suppressor-like RCC1 family protein
VTFDASTTTRIVGGLANGIAHTFTVKAINALGNESASSAASQPVMPGRRLAASYSRSCAIVAGGAVKCWPGGFQAPAPAAVPDLSDATEITVSDNHACALVVGGQVKCWGSNFQGQLGNGTTQPSATPVPVTGITNAIAVAAQNAYSHTCALLADGTVSCWGGGPDQPSQLTPVPIAGITNATAIGVGYGHTCAVVSGGAVKCWGHNEDGQLGNGTTSFEVTTTPVDVIGITGATAVTGGVQHTCVRQPGGVMRCWGGNQSGVLGDGTWAYSGAPGVSVSGMTGARVIAGGWYHTCAITDGGVPKCWGDPSFGQIGAGTNTQTSTPTTVVGIANAIAIATGGYHTCALVIETVSCWGYNEFGQLGTGIAGSGSSTPVQVIGL